ncbi:MAG: MFS transporter [bacterium]
MHHNTDQKAQSTLPLFLQQRFLPLWTSFCLGVFTDNTLKQALIIGITFSLISIPDIFGWLPGVTTGPDIVPYAGALFALAMVIFSPIAGQVADKYPPVFMFKLTKGTEVILMLIAAFGFLTNNGGLLLLMLFLMGVQSAFFSPVRISSMPKYFAANELVRSNALFSGGLFISNSLAYAIGGAVISMAQGAEILAITLVSAALIGMVVVFFIPAKPADASEVKIDLNIFWQYVKMVQYITAEPGVIRPILGASAFFFCVTAVTINVPYFARDVLHGDGQLATIIMISFMIGPLIGTIITASLPKSRSGLGFSALALLLAIITLLVVVGFSLLARQTVPPSPYSVSEFFRTPYAYPILGGLTAAAAFLFMFIVPLQAAIQRRAQAEYRARIMAAANVLNAAAAFIGSLSVTVVTSGLLEPEQLFIVIALLQLAIVGYMYHRKRSVPAGLYDEMLTT